MISKQTKEMIWHLKENEHMNNSEISKQVGVSRGKVIEILKNPQFKNAQLVDKINKIQQEHNEKLLDMLQNDNRLPSIADKILNIMDDDEMLEAEIKRNGLRPLATIFGILSDKAIKVAEISKTSSNNDNVTVKIVNNAPEVPQYETEEDKDGININ